MRVFVFEFFTGGGCYTLPEELEPTPRFIREGGAMLRALIEDFTRCAGVTVAILADTRWQSPGPLPRCEMRPVSGPEEFDRHFSRLCEVADYTLVIGPESRGILLSCVAQAESLGARLLSPSARFVAWAANKHATAEVLARHGVRGTEGWTPGEFLDRHHSAATFPVIIKPACGAGSEGIRMCGDADTVRFACATAGDSEGMRIERFYPGHAYSRAVMCGPQGVLWLPLCEQHLSSDDTFRYEGGRVLSTQRFEERLRRQLAGMDPIWSETIGYVGIDLVLGPDEEGADDVVIEVNPRLTTSYVGLRSAVTANLAECMLSLATGGRPNSLVATRDVRFSSDGTVHAVD
ncbi:MAG TPA: ATP-grasp domain-containing protein [Pirellulaceae bacterium]